MEVTRSKEGQEGHRQYGQHLGFGRNARADGKKLERVLGLVIANLVRYDLLWGGISSSCSFDAPAILRCSK